MGVFEGVSAGQFDGTVEGAEAGTGAAGEDFEGVGADAVDFPAGLGDGVDLLLCRRLRPGKGVEDGLCRAGG